MGMEMKIIVEILYGDRKINQFMHSADIFEPGKQLVTNHENYTITGTDIKLPLLCENVAKAFEKGGDKNVVFVAIKSINDKRVKDAMPYFKPETQSISNGKTWGLFKDVLMQMGYEVETSQHMHVTNVKIKKHEKV
jgi:hypothetical protein